MPRKSKFAVGAYAFSTVHLQLVRVMGRAGAAVTVTRAVLPDDKPLKGTVEDKDLLTLRQFEAWAKEQPVAQDEPDPPMPVVITRTVYVPAVTADETLPPRVLLFAGRKFRVDPDYEEQFGLDWLRPVEGGLLGIPADAWEVDTSDVV